MNNNLWKNRVNVITEFYQALKNIKRLNTSFKIINDNVLSPSIIAICARPSVGKSLLVDQIGHEFVNSGFRWLSFQLELDSYTAIKRELKYSNVPYEQKEKYLESTLNLPIDVVESVNVDNLYNILYEYKKAYPTSDVLVSIDHLFLIGGTDYGKKLAPIFDTIIKFKKLGFYFIVVSHLKREIYLPERCKQGHPNNQIFESDVYMSDLIIQNTDLALAMDIPFRRGINLYSKNKISVGENDVMINTLKNRSVGKRSLYHYVRNEDLTYKFVNEYDDSGTVTPIKIEKPMPEDDDNFNDDEIF